MNLYKLPFIRDISLPFLYRLNEIISAKVEIKFLKIEVIIFSDYANEFFFSADEKCKFLVKYFYFLQSCIILAEG